MAGTLTGGRGRGPAVRTSIGAVAISVATVLPMFLTGGLSVQIGADLDFPPSALGTAPAAFFGAMTLGSPFAGRLVARLGAPRAARASVLAVAAVLALVALAATSLPVILGGLAVAGAANAIAQPAVNQLVARGVPQGRQGVSYGVKYSSIPVASMLAGTAVPVFGLTVGWRWAFAAFAVMAAAAALWRFGAPQVRGAQSSSAAGEGLPRRLLVALAVGISLAAAGGSTLAIFLVTSAVESGWSEANAGVLLAGASVVGIAARLLSGIRADRRGRNHLWAVTVMLAAGSAGVMVLAVGDPVWFLVGAPIAYAAGWGWPGVFILSVVRLNPADPAAATGLVQIGTSAGCVYGPLVFGVLAENVSFTAAWAGNALALLCAAGLIALTRRRILRYLATHPHDFARGGDTTPLGPTTEGSHMNNRDLVESYFAACTAGDAPAIAGHFRADATVYDLNHDPVQGAEAIGAFYVRVRDRWKGASWEVNTFADGPDASTAAAEWTMRGEAAGKPFTVRGSEHYEFAAGWISQIRQYWTYDRHNPETGLRGYPYATDPRFTDPGGQAHPGG